MSEWISVKDRLPKKGGFYLVYRNATSVANYWPKWKVFGGIDPTHWKPLPKPPEGQNV